MAFLDESGFRLIPNVRRTWAPRGQTPIVRHRYRHDRISAISAATVSYRRQRVGLYLHFHQEDISQAKVVLFLRYLLQEIRGHIVLIWDGGSVHTGQDVREFLRRHPRLHIESFPAYAPELNPDEGVWGHHKRALANGRPTTSASALTYSAGSRRRCVPVRRSSGRSSQPLTCPLCCGRNVYYLCTDQ